MQGFLRRISMIDTLLSVDWTGIVLWICVVALILCGVAGTVVPALPGIPMIFLGALLAAWIGDFQHITWVPLVVLGVLTIIGLAVDWVAQTMGAQRAGASKWGIMGSLVGTVAGLFMGIVGILFMPLVGAFIGEYIAQRDLRIAGNVGWATWVGMMVGTVVKLGLSFVMIGTARSSVMPPFFMALPFRALRWRSPPNGYVRRAAACCGLHGTIRGTSQRRR